MPFYNRYAFTGFFFRLPLLKFWSNLQNYSLVTTWASRSLTTDFISYDFDLTQNVTMLPVCLASCIPVSLFEKLNTVQYGTVLYRILFEMWISWNITVEPGGRDDVFAYIFHERGKEKC